MTLGVLHFVRPLWLLGLIAVVVLGVFCWRTRAGNAAWARVCDAHLLKFLSLGEGHGSRSKSALAALLTALTVAVIAGAGPAWERQETPIFRTADALVIVLDLSVSMLAQDIKPSRLERARFKVIDLLNARQEGQTALVVYANEPFTVSPLTDDTRTIVSQMNALSPDIMPAGGSRLDRALAHAADLLEQAMMPNGRLVVVTDSAGDADIDQAAELAQRGVSVSVLAVGTEQGAPISLGDGGFLKDNDGNIVIPALTLDTLEQVADAGAGRLVIAQASSSDIAQFAQAVVANPSASAPDDRSAGSEQWKEVGPWIILALLPLAAIAFRRGWVLLLVVMVPLGQPVEAAVMDDLWARRDQQAAAALEQGRPEQAAQLAEDPWLKGTAQYEAGNYHAAAQTFSALGTADGHYNRGNALAMLGETDAAIAAYQAALDQAPNHEDAAYNKQVLEQMKQQQEQQEQQEQDNNEQQGEDEGEQQEQQSSDDEQSSESDSEQSEDGEQQQQQSEQQQASEGEEDESDPEQLEAEEFDREQRQAVEQWLRRIPDDPGGLLRRKFMLQYQQRARPPEAEENDW
ncbi:MAG: hypothetical protein DHS20C11_02230 [Lysobacteraceae bacterium]|nr:MAG: hypothetical protein DHS20C11_02230 [Xanthomonadaceae bacterium]